MTHLRIVGLSSASLATGAEGGGLELLKKVVRKEVEEAMLAPRQGKS